MLSMRKCFPTGDNLGDDGCKIPSWFELTSQPFSSPHCQGYLSGLLGNTLMCTHFAGRGEKSAVRVQVIGIMNNMLVLLQVKIKQPLLELLKDEIDSMWSQVAIASYMPVAVFAATAASTGFAVAVSQARLGSHSPSKTLSLSQPPPPPAPDAPTNAAAADTQLSLWSLWQLLVGLAGLVVFPQVLMSSLALQGQGTVGITTLVLVGSYFTFQVIC